MEHTAVAAGDAGSGQGYAQTALLAIAVITLALVHLSLH